MVVFCILVASERGLVGDIFFTITCCNIKVLFSLYWWCGRFFCSSRVGFYINILLWDKLIPHPKTGTLYAINILIIKNQQENVYESSIGST